MKGKTLWYSISGALAGMANGFFGGGGGMVLVPMLTGPCGMDQRRAFANSVLIILPLCALSSLIYLLRSDLALTTALPYLLGGLMGGYLGGRVFHAVNSEWLRRVFALFILYGAWSALR